MGLAAGGDDENDDIVVGAGGVWTAFGTIVGVMVNGLGDDDDDDDDDTTGC